MKIVYISHGGFTHIKPYLNYFSKKGHDVSWIKLAPGPDYGVRTYDLSIGGNYNSSFSKVKYIVSSIKARKLLRKLKPDIVHGHYATSAGLACLITNYHPNIITVHGSDLTGGRRSRIWRCLLKKIFSQAEQICVVSEDLKTMAFELDVSSEKIDVLTLGIDTHKFSYIEREIYDGSRPLRFVNTRRLEPVYDHPTIIKAMAVLKNKGINFKMTFVGYGELEGELKKMAREYGLEDNIIFQGGCDNADMPKFLHNNDIYLSASLWDGTSLCLLEAMSSGIFPIVSDIPANCAWITDGQTGFLHQVGDENHLAECILQYIDKPGIALTSSRQNRALVEKRGDRIINMKKLEAICHRLCIEYQ